MRGMVIMGGYDSTREVVKWGVQGGSPCHFLELTYVSRPSSIIFQTKSL
jgi:hypothetical protein